jgi:hypothetical protein
MRFSGKSQIVKDIQSQLGLTVDGVDGTKTWGAIVKGLCKGKSEKELIQFVQRILQVDDDGVDGPITWKTIKSLLVEKEEFVTPSTYQHESEESVKDSLSPNALKLIIDYEVGGGEGYYNRYLKKPCWPKGASGVTVGVGYDLGYNSSSQFHKDWGGKISDSDFDRLKKCLGYKGSAASKKVSSVADIEIPWESALNVFKLNTIPRFVAITLRAFPGADALHPDAFGALVSLVFNRGGSVKGSRRVEMARIRDLVPSKNYDAIAQEIRSMKRIWAGKGLDGLLRRRDKEAALVDACS